MTNVDSNTTGKNWELSLYELNRTPHEIISDYTEVVITPRNLQSELMCPICLDMLKTTMTTKECLHRFCQDCIITALRAGNKECPTCRKKLISKRSLRADPNFDMLISKIYPNRDEYDSHQEKVIANVNKNNFMQNVEETLRMQVLSRARTKRAPNEEERNLKNSKQSEFSNREIQYNGDLDDFEGDYWEESGDNESLTSELELVIRPLPQLVRNDPSLNQTRYIKTSMTASIDHIAKYLEMRYGFEGSAPKQESLNLVTGKTFDSLNSDRPNSSNDCDTAEGDDFLIRTNASGAANMNGSHFSSKRSPFPFTIYIAGGPGQFNPISGSMSLQQVHDKHWKLNRPVELYYAYKMESSATNELAFASKNGAGQKTW